MRIEANGYIDYRVDFVASLSEACSNSWCDEVSMSENDPNAYSESDEYDDEDGKPRVKFDRDDGH